MPKHSPTESAMIPTRQHRALLRSPSISRDRRDSMKAREQQGRLRRRRRQQWGLHQCSMGSAHVSQQRPRGKATERPKDLTLSTMS
eukprot:6690167-Pyramimonas_sp.AAC.1